MADKDAQLELKKRARRRLVGAVALALLAAIVLPIVMDQEPQPANQDIQVRIPARDTPFDPRSLAPRGPEAAPPQLPKPDTGAAPDTAAAPAAVVTGPVSHAPEHPTEEVAAKPADKPPQKPVAKLPEKPLPIPAKPATEAARAQAILDARDEFVVQLGVFGDPANVRKVQARVKAEGYNSFTETISGGRTRVRAGPFASRELAEKARDKLKRGGLDGMVAPKS